MGCYCHPDYVCQLVRFITHKAGEVEIAGNFMLKNVNTFQNVDACLHFLASNCALSHVGMHCKSNQVAYIMETTIKFQQAL